MHQHNRRDFLKGSLGLAAAAGLAPLVAGRAFADKDKELPFKISLAQWSLHKTLFLFLATGKGLDPLDFARTAKEDYGIDAVEYVNQFYMAKKKDDVYLKELKKRADDNGVTSVLIMCDNEGYLGDPDEKKRTQAVENHYRWVEWAKFLGCHSIRVNAHTGKEGTPEEKATRVADGLRRLCEFGDKHDINVIVENHGDLSSNGEWLVGVMKMVNHKRVGTLPDFGNFGDYDRYKGVKEMMPFARGVSAKSYDFDDQGEETKIDYHKMMRIVFDAGYRGRVGIEYEGNRLSEPDGIKATKKLLEKIRQELW